MANFLNRTAPRGGELTRDEYAKGGVWVLVVDWDIPLRWATNTLTVTDEEGTTFLLRGGLEVVLREPLSLFGSGPPDIEVSFNGLRPAPGLNLGAEVLQGRMLNGVGAELSQWHPDRPWEERRVVASGVVSGSRPGGVDEPFSMTMSQRLREDLPKTPSTTQQITTDTWPDNLSPDAGSQYPIVYGLPGSVERDAVVGHPFGFLSTWSLTGGSPAPILIYEGEEYLGGAGEIYPTGEYTGLPPLEDESPARVYALVTAEHAVNGTAYETWRVRNYGVSSIIGGAPAVAGDISFNSSLLNLATLIYVNKTDNFGESLEGLPLLSFYGASVSVRDTSVTDEVVTYIVSSVTEFADYWRLGVTLVDGTGVVTTANTVRFRVELEDVSEANTVTIVNSTREDAKRDDLPILNTVDSLGQTVTIVELTEAFVGEDPWVIGDALYTVWDESEGALLSDRTTGLLRGAGGLCEQVLRRGGVNVDTAGFEGLREELDHYKIDTFRITPRDAWEFVQGVILPTLPVGLKQGVAGISPVLWRWDIGPEDSQGSIVAGRLGIERIRQPKISEVWSNVMRILYGPRLGNESYDKVITVAGLPIVGSIQQTDVSGEGVLTLNSQRQHPTAGTLASVSRLGSRETKTLEALAISDDNTAERIASWRAAYYASPITTVELRDKQSSWAHVAIGGYVMYTDEELGWVNRLGMIVSRNWQDEWSSITISFNDDPARS